MPMYSPYLISISVKGILIENKKVWLRKNEREEWELPGGKLDKGEQPEIALTRELKEELGFDVEVLTLVQAYLYQINQSVYEGSGVLVISYICTVLNKSGKFETIGEAGKAEFNRFTMEEVKKLTMRQFYKDAILKAFSL